MKKRYEKITNLNLATFLYAKGQQIAGIDKLFGRQKEFAFVKTDRLEELMWIYKFGDADDENTLVNVHKLEQSRKFLLDRINEK